MARLQVLIALYLAVSGVHASYTRWTPENTPQVEASVAVPRGDAVLPPLSQGLEKRQIGIFPPAPGRNNRALECFQVAQPVLTQTADTIDAGMVEPTAEKCEVILMDYVFGNSYGHPFVGDYAPPKCNFNRVVMNFSVVSVGRQYDRLAIMYMNDTEVWRTSTAEPTRAPGIHWDYLKDMTPFLSFWKQPQRIIFDLGNLVNDKYNGTFNATLTASFFTSAVQTNTAPPADLILPISRRVSSNGDGGGENPVSRFSLPEDAAANTIASFPRNANRAVLSISAVGQAAEEFWWANVLETDRFTFNSTAGELPGFSPFREVQALIDGNLAGVQWPFPVIFTGGVVPSFHRPVVGLEAFDLLEHEIDITPWLPMLCDGQPHTFAFQITALDGDSTSSAKLRNGTNPSWIVTGKIFIWLDDAGSITTGTMPETFGTTPKIEVSRTLGTDALGQNSTLDYTVDVRRDVIINSTIKTQKYSGAVSWTQKLTYRNVNNYTAQGMNQRTDFSIEGSESATRNGSQTTYGLDYSYPLRVLQAVQIGTGEALAIQARLYQGLARQVTGAATFPDGLEAFATRPRYEASTLSTYREGTASYSRSSDGLSTTGSGNIHQEFSFGGNFARYDAGARSPSRGGDGGGFQTPDVTLYYRNVTAANDAVTRDVVRKADALPAAATQDNSSPPSGLSGQAVLSPPQQDLEDLEGVGTGGSGVGEGMVAVPADFASPRLRYSVNGRT